MFTRGKPLVSPAALLDYLDDPDHFVIVADGETDKDIRKTSKDSLSVMNFQMFRYYESVEYDGPFGGLVWSTAKKSYVFRPDPNGSFVTRERYEQDTNSTVN